MHKYEENAIGIWEYNIDIWHFDPDNRYVQNIIATDITVTPNAIGMWEFLSSYNPHLCTMSYYTKIQCMDVRVIYEIRLMPKSTENKLTYEIEPKIIFI